MEAWTVAIDYAFMKKIMSASKIHAKFMQIKCNLCLHANVVAFCLMDMPCMKPNIDMCMHANFSYMQNRNVACMQCTNFVRYVCMYNMY